MTKTIIVNSLKYHADNAEIEANMLAQWMTIYQKYGLAGANCIKNLLSYRFPTPRQISIYCNTDAAKLEYTLLEKLLVSELHTDKSFVLSLISDNTVSLNEIPRYSYVDDPPDADCILCPSPLIYPFAKKYSEKFGIKLIALNELLNDIYPCLQEQQLIEKLVQLRNNGTRCLFVKTPVLKSADLLSEYERYCIDNDIRFGGFSRDREVFDRQFALSDFDTHYDMEEYWKFIHTNSRVKKPYKDYYRMTDCTFSNINVENGIRVTPGQPTQWDFTVHLFGDSTLFNSAMYDNETISAVLQSLINISDKKVRVINYGTEMMDLFRMSKYIEDVDIKPNDIVICFRNTLSVRYFINVQLCSNNISVIDCNELFARPHSFGEVYIDAKHLNFRGARVVAERIYKAFFESNFAENQCLQSTYKPRYLPLEKCKGIPIAEEYYNPITSSTSFRNYVLELSKRRKTVAEKTGAIVMNCNPFTFGHRYLIEAARAQVEHLYILVVEEDRSEFKFKDRFEMIKRGVQDIDGVDVIPSGQFVISTVTFPEYFDKDAKQSATIDPTMDVEIFCGKIAPALGVTRRFAGEEPLDRVTDQYNQKMAEILPKHGMEFIVIPRKELGGAPISASRVRKLMSEGRYGEIKQLVPETTYSYLQNIKL